MNRLAGKQIAWVSDYSVKQFPYGGAEITDNYLIQEGRRRLAEVRRILCDGYNRELINNSDLVVLSNNLRLSLTERDYIIKNKKYICLVQDCGRWLEVCAKTEGLLANSAINIYMSPGQEALYKEFFPNQKSICIPPKIPTIFHNMQQERKDKALYVGLIHEGKGIQNIIDYPRGKNIEIDVYGYYQEQRWLDKIATTPGLTFCGSVSMGDLPAIYNKYKYYIHLPIVYESFSRTTAEAMMCGCEIIHNDKLGLLSYHLDSKGLMEKVSNADIKFWEEIANKLSND